MLQKIDKDRLVKVLSVIEESKIKFPIATISKDLDKDKGMVSAYLSGKKPMSTNFYSTFLARYDIASKTSKSIEEAPITGEKAIDTIYILASSNRTLADNNTKIIMQNDKIIDQQSETVKTNVALATMLNAALDKVITVGSRQDDVEDVISRHPALLGLLADLGIPKLWQTREEGISTLGIQIAAEKSKKKKGGNVADASR